jgi:hypothetical protein
MRQHTVPPFPAWLYMVLCLAFVVGLASRGLPVSRRPSPGVRPTMDTMRDPTSLVTAGAREPMGALQTILGYRAPTAPMIALRGNGL